MLQSRIALDLPVRVNSLNEWYRLHSAAAVLTHALRSPDAGQLALVSSFGAESVVLLHMVSVIDTTTPVIFIDTQMLFAETLTYQQEVCAWLGLTDVRIIRPAADEVKRTDAMPTLYQRDTDACCALRKTRPLQKALDGFDGWITGRKRYHGSGRADLDFFEVEDDTGRMKINPLAHWTRADVQTYMEENALPRHPLVKQGYPSIGCTPCTSPTTQDEDIRAGRWRGTEKSECGIHFENGKAIRTGERA